MSQDARIALEQLWRAAGLEGAALARVTLTGADPLVPTDFRIGTAAAAVIAAAGLAAAELWRLRTGRAQSVAVDGRAAVAAFRSERYLRVNGDSAGQRDPIFGFYQAGDGRWIQIHSNMPHHREGALRLLGCESTREAVTAAVGKWTAEALEDALAAAGLPTGMVRSRHEWHAHPQGHAVAALPVLEIARIGDAPPEPVGAGPRPLSAVRVLDLTRVIAGPVCGRTLAAFGADVMLVTAPHLPSLPDLVIDTGLGKLAASLDLRTHRARRTSCARSSAAATSSASPIVPAPSPARDSGRRISRGCARASSTSRCRPSAIPAPGGRDAASRRSSSR